MSDTDFFDDDLLQRKNVSRQTLAGQAVETGSGIHYDEIPVRPVSDLNLTRMAKHREEINGMVADKMKNIEQLRRRQNDLERERQNLEEFSRKQESYERGKTEMMEKLTQSMVALEKQENRAVRLAELYSGTRRQFLGLHKELEVINDEGWADANFREELSKAVAVIENSRKEYNKALASIEAANAEASVAGASVTLSPAEPAMPVTTPPMGFFSWMRIGLALMLPLGIFVLLVGIALAIIMK